MTEPCVSIVVATYEREAVLCQTLQYLLDLDFTDRELIVVDQTRQHTDATTAFLAAHGDAIRLIRIERANLPHARNVGLQAARGEFILFCDDDIIPPSDLIVQHLKNYAEDDVAGVCGGITGFARRGFAPRACVIRRDGKLQPFWEHDVPRGEVDSMLGCNMSWRRSVLLDAGGFDEGYVGRANWEETDMSLRVRRMGGRLIYEPDAAVVHLMAPGGGTRASGRNSLRYVYESHRNNAYFFARLISPRYLAAFLKREVGWIVIKRGLLRREPQIILPALRGIVDGLWSGWRSDR